MPTTGLITSLGVGSGLDLSSLLSALEQNANQALTPITNQESSTQTEISAFGTIQSAMSSLADAVKTISNPATFQAVSSKVQGSAVTASSTANAPTGQYQVSVQQLAQASSVATDGVASETSDLGAGTVDFTFGNGKTASVKISAGDSSLTAVAKTINDADDGVQASVINDGSGSPWRLVLQSDKTGSAASVSEVSFSGALGSKLSVDSATQQAGQDAKLDINGIAITSASNTVQDAITGTTLNLASTGSATVGVSTNDGAIESDVKSFVTAYNGVISAVNKVASYDANTKVAGPLFGNSTVQAIRSQLAGLVDGLTSGGSFSGLAQLGVSLQTDGTLKLDSSTLDSNLASDPKGVQQFFTGANGNDGFASQMNSIVRGFAGPTGMIDSATTGLQNTLTSLQKQQQVQQQQINQTMANYQQEFDALDTTIAKLNSTSNYLSQQFASLNKGSSSSSRSGS